MNEVYLPEGGLYSSRENALTLASPAALEKAMKSGRTVEGIVTLCDRDLNLHVDLHCAEGIIPAGESVFCRPGEERKDIALLSRVGKPVCFKIRALESVGGSPVADCSRRDAQKECFEQFLLSRSPGDILQATVTHLEPFGAFLDIGCGLSSLLPIDCVSVSRISHPRDRLSVGQTLPVAVKTIDRLSGRIFVTLRELLGTWEENAALFEVGQTVAGTVRSVEPYGIFVELTPNLAGLAEVKSGSAEEWKKLVGRSAAVFIKSILPEKMKVKLVLIDSSRTPRPPRPLRVFLDPSARHLSRWVYSPASSSRMIFTDFDQYSE